MVIEVACKGNWTDFMSSLGILGVVWGFGVLFCCRFSYLCRVCVML